MMIWNNYFKREARIIKRGSSYDNILSTVVNLLSVTNNTEDSTDSILQDITYLSSETLNNDFILMGENISNFPELVTGAYVHAPRQRNSTYVHTARRSIYNTRKNKHPH